MNVEQALIDIRDYIESDNKLKADIISQLSKSNKVSWNISLFNDMENGVEYRDNVLEEPSKMLETIQTIIKTILDDSETEVFPEVQLVGLNPTEMSSYRLSIQQLMASHIDKLIILEGLIKAKTDIIKTLKSITWRCRNCENDLSIMAIEGNVGKPSKCGCGGQSFSPHSRQLDNKIILTMEESLEDVAGTEVKMVKVIIRGALVSPKFDKTLVRGSRIRVTGILKSEMKVKDKQIKEDLVTYILANNIETLQDEYREIVVTDTDRQDITGLGKEDRVKYWADEMFGSLHGYEEVKESLICQLVGGVKIKKKTKFTRGNIHILLLGDPGIGKSTFLKIVQNIALKARYASGKSTSAVGITANVAKDDTIGSWVAEAGVFPLSHNGILCLDEFDKISNDDKSALHEGMEQQTITVNKASIHVTLIAETSLLAAANPKKGRFNNQEEMYEQFDLLPTLVNRFDLIFLFIDKPKAVTDEAISEKIIDSFIKDEEETDVNTDLFKKYLIVAKEIEPTLNKTSILKIKEMYMAIRAKINEIGNVNIPISPRALESAIRLSVSHARARLSNSVEEKDVSWAIDMMLFSLGKISVDLFVFYFHL